VHDASASNLFPENLLADTLHVDRAESCWPLRIVSLRKITEIRNRNPYLNLICNADGSAAMPRGPWQGAIMDRRSYFV
jgi:hypothetical protein